MVLGLKVMDRGLAKDIRQATVSTMGPVWKTEVEARARTRQDARVLVAGARIAGGNPPAALAGTSARRLRGGGRPSELAGGVEFGANRNVKSTYSTRSRRGTPYQVTRRTRRQFPNRAPKGRVVWPAFGEVGPRMVALWVQLVVRRTYDAVDRGASGG